MFWRIIRLLKPVAVPLMEYYFRISELLLLIFLSISGRGTIRKCVGLEHVRSGRIVIFATYPNEKLYSGHVKTLEQFEALGYSIIVATNHPRGEALFGDLMSKRWCFLFRRPFGRDFGCYKDGMLTAYKLHDEKKIELKRVVLLNDSVITFSAHGDCVVKHLADERFKFSGMTENYNFCHHVGSFMVGLDADVVLHRRVVKYWKRYLPLSTRRYSIQRGEFGLSRVVRKAGFVPHIKFTLSEIKILLEAMDLQQLNAIANSMEPHFRKQVDSIFSLADERLYRFLNPFKLNEQKPWKPFRKPFIWSKKKALQAEMEAALAMQSDTGRNYPLTGSDYDHMILSMVRYREQFIGIDRVQQGVELEKRVKEDIIDSIVQYVFRGSQIHHGAAVLLFVGAGILKKDVVLRRIVEPFNIKKLLVESGASTDMAEIDEACAEILSKGHPYALRGKALLMYDWDFV